jgi:hypothetical protein
VPAKAWTAFVRASPLEVSPVQAATGRELELEGAAHDVDGRTERDERCAQVGRRRFAVGAALDRLDNASVSDEHNAGCVEGVHGCISWQWQAQRSVPSVVSPGQFAWSLYRPHCCDSSRRGRSRCTGNDACTRSVISASTAVAAS